MGPMSVSLDNITGIWAEVTGGAGPAEFRALDWDLHVTVLTVTDLPDVYAWRAHLRRGLANAMKARDSTATSSCEQPWRPSTMPKPLM